VLSISAFGDVSASVLPVETLELIPDPHCARIEIDVFPAQAESLTLA